MNESQIFANALNLATPAERAAYLDEACAGDPPLRADVEALLRAHASDPGFLEQPAGPIEGTAAEAATPGLPTEPGGTEDPGRLLAGRYKLLEQVGEGGMGSVWMAQQTEPVQRLVAVKLIKPGMDSKQVLARFEAERQALALMDHPHIAKVLDAGAVSDGRPFFVMELVKGVPITRYCDERRLTPRQRLELFVPVCQAIQHAHQKGIIHRDVKPSNVLVALYDDRPVVKVIDFGVAKATGQPLTERTLHTGFGAVVGTLEYMSPEQAGFNQLDVDTRSDIYSLGVLLYELLTGSPPFGRKELEKAGVLEMLRVIREEEPSRPSTKLSTADGLPTLAANRGTVPSKLTRLVRGELDWIVMKALEKDRNRRYETANDFVQDVRYYLADEPVQACPPSMGYRLQKFMRRHRVALGMAGTVAGMLILAVATLAFATVQINDALLARTEALNDKTTAFAALSDEQGKARTALEQQRLALYSYRIGLAHREWEKGRVSRARFLLEECPPPLRRWEWHHLWRLCHMAHRTLPPSSQAYDAVFTPDGKAVAVLDLSAHVRFFEGTDWRTVRQIPGPRLTFAFALSPDGSLVAAAPQNQGVILWDRATGKKVRTLPVRPTTIGSLAFSPDGKYLVAHRQGQRPEPEGIWDVNSGEQVRAFTVPQEGPIAFVDGHTLIRDRKTGLVVEDVVTGQVKKQWNVEKRFLNQPVFDLKLSPDRTRLLTVHSRGLIRVWDYASGALLETLHNPSRPNWVAFGPDSKRVASAHSDGTVRLWTLSPSRQEKHELPVQERHVALRGHDGEVRTVAFSPDGKYLVSTGADHEVKVWDANPAAAERSLIARDMSQGGVHQQLAFSPDSSRLAAVAVHHLTIWDVETTAAVIDLFNGASRQLFSVAFSPDGKQLATGEAVKGVCVREAQTGKETWTSGDERWAATTVAFSPDGRLLAFDSIKARTVRLWNADKGQEIRTLPHTDEVTHFVISPDGRLLASCNYRMGTKKFGGVHVWELATGQQLFSLGGNRINPIHLAFSPDGRLLAAGLEDRTVKVWEMSTREELLSLAGHSSPVNRIAFHPDAERLAAGTEEGSVVIWDLTTGRDALTLRVSEMTRIRDLAFSPNGRWLAAAHKGGVHVWDGLPSD